MGHSKGVSWRIISEGTFYGFLSMLVAEERVLPRPVPVSWLFFLTYLICRCTTHYRPESAETLRQISRPCRIFAWILISGAMMIASVSQP